MKNLCLIIAFSPLVALLPAQAPAPVGVQLYTFRHQMAKDVPGTLTMIRDMGFEYVESGLLPGMDALQTRRMLDGYNLKVAGTSADFKELSDPAKIDAVADRAKTLGADIIVCFWIPHDGDNFTIADIEKAVDVFNQAGKALREKGFPLLYHPHGYEFRAYGDKMLFDVLVEKTDPKYLNFEMDVYWVFHPGQDPVRWLQKYPDRWKALHLKDRAPGTPGNQNGRTDVESNVVIGSGEIDMQAILEQARKLKIRYYFIEDESSRSVEQVPASIEYLRQVME